MNKNAKKWIKALRSGKYTQGTGKLRDKDKFCCLGVACDLYDKNIWLNLDQANVLPYDVMRWLNLSHNEGSYYNKGRQTFLTYHNDFDKYTFSEIADIIESEPEGLFRK